MILHIDMDAFFASIEQVINPRLKKKPLIVGSRNHKFHTVVCAASYEAKNLGIDSGMPTAEAFKICPNLAFVPAQQGRYIWTSEQILRMLKGYSFEVYYASIDEFQMDIRDTSSPENLAQTIQKQIWETFHITASIGIAKNCLLSKLASKINKPKGIAILTEANMAQILSRIPAQKLSGVGEKLGQILQGLGVKTCLDIYQKTPYFMKRNFGQNGLNLYASLHSVENFDIPTTEDKPKSIGHSYTLPRASKNAGFIKAWIRLLSEMVAKRLRENKLSARTQNLWLSGPGMPNFGAQKTFQEAVNDGYDIYHRCLKIMTKLAQNSLIIRALGVSCSNLQKDSYPPLLKEQKRREDLIKALDKINDSMGEHSIYPAVVTLTRKMK